MKRLFDILLSLFGLGISLPLWVISALLIWLSDGGPIFYVQERAGKHGRIFKGLKFRSMTECAEADIGPRQAQENDARITRIGILLRATAMDELPQLINILKGDMSFVGPRALVPVEIDKSDGRPRGVWEFEGFKERSSVRPGLTGLAQVLAPRDIERAEKFKYDIWYVRNQSLWLDIKIMLVSFMISIIGKWETRHDKISNLGKWLTQENTRGHVTTGNA